MRAINSAVLRFREGCASTKAARCVRRLLANEWEAGCASRGMPGSARGTIVITGDATATTSVSRTSQKRRLAGARRRARAVPIPINAIAAVCHAALTTNVTMPSAIRSTALLLFQHSVQPPQGLWRQLLRLHEAHDQRFRGAAEDSLHDVVERGAERALPRDCRAVVIGAVDERAAGVSLADQHVQHRLDGGVGEASAKPLLHRGHRGWSAGPQHLHDLQLEGGQLVVSFASVHLIS